MMTKLKKYLSQDKTIRIASIVSTQLVRDATAGREFSPLALTLTGRALTGAVLMAGQLKEGQRVGLHFKGDGPLGSLFAEASYEGRARAYCFNTSAQLSNDQSISDGLGSGTLELVKSLPFQKEPHRGVVTLVSGEIGLDLAYYFRQSYQVPSIVSVSTMPDETGCEAAGGYIIELMPGYSEETVDKLEAIQSMCPPIHKLIKDGAGAADLVADFLVNFPFEELEHPFSCHYACDCSMERIENSVRILGKAEIKSMIRENKIFDVSCQFCGKIYEVNPLQLQRILD